eukprot:gene35920-46633_t
MVVMNENTLSSSVVISPDKISSSSVRGSSNTNLNTSNPAVVHKSRKSLSRKSGLVQSNPSRGAGVSVYKRIPQYPKSFSSPNVPSGRFIVPGDADYDRVLSESYHGFVTQEPSEFDQSFHISFRKCFLSLEENNIFQFDLTQPAGLNSKSDPSPEETPGETRGVAAAFREIGRLNRELVRHTEKLLRDRLGDVLWRVALRVSHDAEGPTAKKAAAGRSE